MADVKCSQKEAQEMTKRSPDDTNDPRLKIIIEEAAYLEWINRALRKQINLNENRLAEIDKELAKEMSNE